MADNLRRGVYVCVFSEDQHEVKPGSAPTRWLKQRLGGTTCALHMLLTVRAWCQGSSFGVCLHMPTSPCGLMLHCLDPQVRGWVGKVAVRWYGPQACSNRPALLVMDEFTLAL